LANVLSPPSRQSLKKYVKANNKITTTSDAQFDSLFNKALKVGTEKGVFEQPKGPSGGTKLAKKAAKPAAAKPAAKKETTTTTKKPAAKKAAPKKEASEKTETKAKKPAAKKATEKKAAAPKAKKAAAPKKVCVTTLPPAYTCQLVLTSPLQPAASKVKTGRVTKATEKKTPAKKAAPKKAAAPKSKAAPLAT
jgi:histone H1/5